MKITYGEDGTHSIGLAGTTDWLNLDVYTKK